ncbi:MAG: glycosyltransferase family 2 protein, partial [Methanomicrobiales archaeon]|nr:glycosyltransferase family 2 protein [Methanomicrobiales archaeon]
MYSQHSIGVVIPAYNEEELIESTLYSIPSYVDRVYVVDDASTDGTGGKIQNLRDLDRITYIRHDRNRGVGAAIATGYKQALQDGVDVVAVMAGDNQMDPRYLPGLLDPIVWKMADYTKGNRLIHRTLRKGMPRWRSFGNSILTYITKMSCGYFEMIDPQNGYTAISRQTLSRLNLDEIYPRYGYLNDMLAKLNVLGCRIMDVVIPARYGEEKSKIRYGFYILQVSWLLLKTFLWRLYMKYFVLNFHPLIIFYVTGFLLSLVGMVSVIYSVYAKVVYGSELFIHGILSLMLFM